MKSSEIRKSQSIWDAVENTLETLGKDLDTMLSSSGLKDLEASAARRVHGDGCFLKLKSAFFGVLYLVNRNPGDGHGRR